MAPRTQPPNPINNPNQWQSSTEPTPSAPRTAAAMTLFKGVMMAVTYLPGYVNPANLLDLLDKGFAGLSVDHWGPLAVDGGLLTLQWVQCLFFPSEEIASALKRKCKNDWWGGGRRGERRGGWVRRKAGGLTGSNQNAGVGNAALSPADSSNIKS